MKDVNIKQNKINKILFAGAMETEISPLLKKLNAIQINKLLGVFPLYKAIYKSRDIFIVKTYVGDVNASIAGMAAIQYVNPDYVIKFGAVGGSYSESKTGDIIIPLGFFHRTSWITRSKINNAPTHDSSLWESVFGELPYQVNSGNLGGLPYYFPVDSILQTACRNALNILRMNSIDAYVGGGNMWMFDKKFLHNVAATMLPKATKNKRFVSDMESYSLAHVSFIMKKTFIGCFTVASNDYLDEPYDPARVPTQMKRLVPYALKLIDSLI